jgi:hypothetical protein
LKYRVLKGALSQDDVDALRACKDRLMAFLEDTRAGAAGAATSLYAGAAIHLVPLAFSQLAHWRIEQLAQERSYAVVGIVTRWRGPLNVLALKTALREMIRRHDALRTRIVVWEGTPLQEIRDCADCELGIDELTGQDSCQREAELLRCIDRCMCEPVDVTDFPLFRFNLIRVWEDDHVLVTAMEHIITDGFSLNLFLEELYCVYRDVAQGRTSSLPPVPIQFSDYAIWQRSAMRSWTERHAPYWAERLNVCQRMRPPRGALASA